MVIKQKGSLMNEEKSGEYVSKEKESKMNWIIEEPVRIGLR